VTNTWDAGGGLTLDGLSVTLASGLPPSPPPPPVAPGAPAAPTGLAVRAVSANEVTLAWTDNSSNETAFAHPHAGTRRKTGAGDWERIGRVPPKATSYLDGSAKPGTSYTYRVRATNNSGASDWSNELTVRTPGG
jgi:hypothetical protein